MLDVYIFDERVNQIFVASIDENATISDLIAKCKTERKISEKASLIELYPLENVVYSEDIDFDDKWVDDRQPCLSFDPVNAFVASTLEYSDLPLVSFCLVIAPDDAAGHLSDYSNEQEEMSMVLQNFLRAVEAAKFETDPPSKEITVDNWESEHRGATGRPYHFLGHPIGIYAPIFEDFKVALKTTTPLDSITPKQCELAHALIQEANEIDIENSERRKRIMSIVNQLLGRVAVRILNNDDSSEDGCILVPTGKEKILLVEAAFFDLRPDITVGYKHANLHIAEIARRAWIQDERKHLRNVSCCPSFLIMIAGPFIHVFGIIFAREPTTESFTGFISIEINNHPLEKRIERVVHLFQCLKDSISALELYYWDLTLDQTPMPRARFPDTTSLPLDGHQLEFRRLLLQGDAGRTTPIFLGMFDSKPCVVKFDHTYGIEAHMVLAKEHLAPELFYHTQIYHESF
ncbi:hypothetical protein DACRYDRAFT_108886 [Dacryopinax primogenitus]|uniref:Uncharacterized protein n=1 Tax=Dacryopinax primogenitus (strain DJM 731) TaxID=1858805 RepID=M5GAB1_DACPD|nr:uncharacterized protein DACRYDRAFT_108886 [Dacryopinax primogenitus]EJU00833.1 hypothetical protein DACRYDRAFT_108886 [Dacryopinax primogenitus]